MDLTDEEKRFVLDGAGDEFEGIRGFFRWLERKKYKVHVRVFLSRYRGFTECQSCGGSRLREEALDGPHVAAAPDILLEYPDRWSPDARKQAISAAFAS